MRDNRPVLPRFYGPALSPTGEFALPSDEARHLTRVLRLGAGAEIAVFDGRGAEHRATVVSAERDRVVVRAGAALPVPQLPPVAVIVVQAVLKGSSMDDAVRDATMVGAAAIEPLITEHVDVKLSVVSRPALAERWRRVALASAKQCRRATLPVIHEPRSLGDWLQSPPAEAKLLFVEPSAGVTPRSLKSVLDNRVPPKAAVLLGPEGGWSPGEVRAALAAGCEPVSLGPLTLRAESMAVAALAALATIWEK